MPQATKSTVESAAAAKPAKPEIAEKSAPQPELSTEAVGWMFLQKYYGSYTTDMAALYTFYDAEASVRHDGYPNEHAENSGEKVVKTVHVAQGNAVRTFYEEKAAKSEEKDKIVVENAAFQPSVAGSIVIVVSGSWKRGTSALWPFVQTFVLKAKGKTVFDIANDVLTFVDYAEEHKDTQTEVAIVEEKPAEKTEADKESGESSEEKKEPVSEPETAAETTAPEPKEAQKEDAEEESATEPAKNVPAASEAKAEPTQTDSSEATTETIETPVAPEPETSSEPEKPAAPAVPAQKPTWANLAAIGPKTTSKTAAVVSPAAVKSVPAVSAPVSAAKKTASPSQAPAQAAPNGKFKKEEWYPIYIKNVDVEEDELKAAIIKQFGDIKYFKKTNKTALCDFKSKDDQQRALETRELVIRSNVILLEPRIHKVFNGKPDAKKDKKPFKKNNNGFKKN
ncbi:hypothetical protein OY671_006575 [Metschnikowia pulcherrima]|nr:hypothetical protein OY671_006575 [Metschnikowia pulcherrima]